MQKHRPTSTQLMQLASTARRVWGTRCTISMGSDIYTGDVSASYDEDSHRAKKPWLAIASQLAFVGLAPAGVGEDERETGSATSLRAAGGLATAGRALGLLTTTSGEGDTLLSWMAEPTLSPLNRLGRSRSLCCTKEESVRVQQ